MKTPDLKHVLESLQAHQRENLCAPCDRSMCRGQERNYTVRCDSV